MFLSYGVCSLLAREAKNPFEPPQGGSRGFLTTYVRVRTIQDKNFMRLVTEINLGLACDRDV